MKFATLSHDERMKLFEERKKINKINNIFVSFVLSMIVVFSFVLLSGAACYINTHYDKDALVIYVNNNTNEIACVTIDGNEWSFFDEGFVEGDEIRVTFSTSNTDNNIYDDEIIHVRKIK